jgi:hypothetical protein
MSRDEHTGDSLSVDAAAGGDMRRCVLRGVDGRASHSGGSTQLIGERTFREL